MDVSGQTVCIGQFTAREKPGFGGWVGVGAGLDDFRRDRSLVSAKI
jgi:hypothetical protein